MDKVVKDIEIAASQCGIESKKELISFASGFAARDAQKRIAELEEEVQRLKAQVGSTSSQNQEEPSKEKAREKSRATEGTKHTCRKAVRSAENSTSKRIRSSSRHVLRSFKRFRQSIRSIQFKPHEPIKITLPDGKVMEGTS